MREVVVNITEGSPLGGRPCRACEAPLAVGQSAVTCPRCKAVHHVDCWKERGGCARRGCPQVAVALAGSQPPPRDPPVRSERWLVTAGALALVFLVVALVFSSQRARDHRPAVTLMAAAYLDHQEALQQALARFQAAHPDMGASLQLVPLMGYEQKLIVLMAAQDSPDIFSIPLDRFPIYAESGAFLPLDDFPVDQALPAELPAPRRDEGLWEGRRLAVPHPSVREVLGIWHRTSHPDLAWALLREVLAALPVVTDLEEREGTSPLLPRLPMGF